MTTYLITNDTTWLGFSSLHSGDRLIVAPTASLVMPDADFTDVGAGGPTAISFAGFVYLDSVTVDDTATFSITSTGQFVSDTAGAALNIGGAIDLPIVSAHFDNAGAITVTNGTAIMTTSVYDTVTNSGRIEAKMGVDLASHFDSLLNTGTIIGMNNAVHMQGLHGTLTNLGTLTASASSVVLVDGDFGKVINSGSITGSSGAIEVRPGVSSFFLTNSGTITGDITSGGSSQDSIVNSGTIHGNVLLGAGNDVYSGGHLTGELLTGLGNDTVDARGNAVSGMIRDTGGSDTYTVDSAATRISDTSAGLDTVLAWTSFALTEGLEVLRLQGAADLTGTGSALANTLAGNAGDNRLFGGAGNDILYGGDGADTLRGGLGADWLKGDDGADTFIFTSLGQTGTTLAGEDTIADFTQGDDHINLSAIDAITGNATADPFSFIGAAAFSHVAGQLHAVQSGALTLVEMDVNGDGLADAVIRLNALLSLTAGDFGL